MASEKMTDIESLYQRYAPDVRRFALFLSGDPVMADEITSDTFLSAWLARDRIRQPRVKSHLFAIARNLYRDLQRRRVRHSELDERMTDKRISAQTHMEQTAELRAVLVALQQLPEMDRTALLMWALDEMPYEEIAEALGIPVVTAKVKVYRARSIARTNATSFSGLRSVASRESLNSTRYRRRSTMDGAPSTRTRLPS
jgi:RNA polymerase sigma-70 factor (ECF subfamily)